VGEGVVGRGEKGLPSKKEKKEGGVKRGGKRTSTRMS